MNCTLRSGSVSEDDPMLYVMLNNYSTWYTAIANGDFKPGLASLN